MTINPQPSANKRQRVFVAGASGYIGRHVVAELVARGHSVVAFLRTPRPGDTLLAGAEQRIGEVSDAASISRDGVRGERLDAFVSCIASRTGGLADAWAVDHQANSDLLGAAVACGASRFVLLSAICVQRPRLAFQQAKRAFEQELAASALAWSIVRPTAFFKSLAGQVPRVQAGKPFLLFGRGDGPACVPISEADVARFMADCLTDPMLANRILPIGGPGEAITPRERGELLCRLCNRPARFRRLPLSLFAALVPSLAAAARVYPKWADKAEFARIGQFYATEPMLLFDAERGDFDAGATPRYGQDTLEAFYRRVLDEGMAGQSLGDQGIF